MQKGERPRERYQYDTSHYPSSQHASMMKQNYKHEATAEK